MIGVYFLKAINTNLVKIGVSDDILSRAFELQFFSPIDLELIGLIRTDLKSDSRRLEAKLHHLYDNFRDHGEWFNFDDVKINYIKEKYYLDIIKDINNLMKNRLNKSEKKQGRKAYSSIAELLEFIRISEQITLNDAMGNFNLNKVDIMRYIRKLEGYDLIIFDKENNNILYNKNKSKSFTFKLK